MNYLLDIVAMLVLLTIVQCSCAILTVVVLHDIYKILRDLHIWDLYS